jgi:hypothetical protein
LGRCRNAQTAAPERFEQGRIQRVKATSQSDADDNRADVDGAQLIERLADGVNFLCRTEID